MEKCFFKSLKPHQHHFSQKLVETKILVKFLVHIYLNVYRCIGIFVEEDKCVKSKNIVF
jgi:hypothetical protein